MRPLFDRLPASRAQTYHLVLSSAAIPHLLRPHGRLWAIDVPLSHRRAAVKSIVLYRSENPPPALPAPSPLGQRSFSAVYVIAALTAAHWGTGSGLERQMYFSAFGADSQLILQGQCFRCITALLLHADGGHLLANAAGLALFGSVVASIWGWGVGWLAILATGALGNCGAALVYGAGHLAIGASTALFGAVGITSVISFTRQARLGHVRSWRAWIPLAGGLALLGFLGTGPQTDLLAHLSGFLFGLLIGAGYALGNKTRRSTPIQAGAAGLAAILVIAAWVAGLYSSG